MPKISLGYNGAVETRLHFEGDDMIMEDHMPSSNVTSILDQNARDRSLGHNTSAIGRHAARVPITLLHSWQKEWASKHTDSLSWSTFLKIKINNPDYSKLRTGVDRL